MERPVSGVWKYLKKLPNKESVQCSICPKILSYKGSSTSVLLKHLDKVHKIKIEKQKITGEKEVPSTSSSQPESEKSSSPVPKRTRITNFFRPCTKVSEIVARLVAQDGISIRAVTRSKFIREAFHDRQLTLPKSEGRTMELVLEYYKQQESIMVEKLQTIINSDRRFSLTLDEWTSLKNRRYLNVNLHSDDGTVFNLGLVFISGKCGAVEVRDMVLKHLDKFGLKLERHIVACTTDGAAVMQKFGRESPTEMMLCINHAVHLAVIDVIYKKKTITENEDKTYQDVEEQCDEVDEDIFSSDSDSDDNLARAPEVVTTCRSDITQAIQDVRKIVKLFRKSPMNNGLLQAYVKEEKGHELQLLLDTRTRWNSLVIMVERFLKLLDSIKKALADINYYWNEENEGVLKKLVQILNPLKLAIEALSRKDATILTCDAILSVLLDTIQRIGTPLSNELYAALDQRIKERRDVCLFSLVKYLHNPESLSSCILETASKNAILKYAEGLFHRLFVDNADTNTEVGENSVHENDSDDDLPLSAVVSNNDLAASFEAKLKKAINTATASISAPMIAGAATKLRREFQVKKLVILLFIPVSNFSYII